MLKRFWYRIVDAFKIPPGAISDKELEERRKVNSERIVKHLLMRDHCE